MSGSQYNLEWGIGAALHPDGHNPTVTNKLSYVSAHRGVRIKSNKPQKLWQQFTYWNPLFHLDSNQKRLPENTERDFQGTAEPMETDSNILDSNVNEMNIVLYVSCINTRDTGIK